VLLRLPDRLLADLDAWRLEVEATLPSGAQITRADLMRHLLQQAVDAHKAARPLKGRKSPPR